MKKIISDFTKSKVNLFIILASLFIVMIVILDIYDREFNFHDILVELHGLIYDLFVFGLVLTIYETRKEKKEIKEKEEKAIKEKIDRYKEEINDFRFWKNDEAKFRITGLVKRLVNLEVKNLNLKHCYLQEANGVTEHNEMDEWDFSGANLNKTLWIMNNCQKSLFYYTELFESTFRKVNLEECKFDSAFLFDTQFKECNFKNVSLNNVIVHTKDWFEEMKWNENIGIEDLENKYEIIELEKSESGIQGYKIIRT